MKKSKKFKSRDFDNFEDENRVVKSRQSKKRIKKLQPDNSSKLSAKDLLRLIDEEE